MYLIIGLLVAIVLLLCTPMKNRRRLVEKLAGLGVLGLVAYHLFPILGGLVAVFYDYLTKEVGWPGVLGGMLGIVGGGTLLMLMIRSGLADRE